MSHTGYYYPLAAESLSGLKASDLGDMGKSILIEPLKNYMTFGNEGLLIIPLLKAVGSLLLPNNGILSITASIPIEEWK